MHHGLSLSLSLSLSHTHTHTHSCTQWWCTYCSPEKPQYDAYYFTLKTFNIINLKTEEAGEGTEGDK